MSTPNVFALVAAVSAPVTTTAPLPANAPSRVELAVFGGLSHLDIRGQRVIAAGTATARWDEDLEPSALLGLSFTYRPWARTGIDVALSVAPWHPREADSCGPGCSRIVFSATAPQGCEPGGHLWPCVDWPLGVYGGLLSAGRSGPTRGTLRAYHADIAVRHDFSTARTAPFVSLGVGRVVYGGNDDGARGAWSLNAGLGLLIHLTRRAQLRLEVNDHALFRHFLSRGVEHDEHVRIGLVVHP